MNGERLSSTSEHTWQKAGSKTEGKSVQKPPAHPHKCPECASQHVWKDGLRYAKTETGERPIQRYLCRACGRRFSEQLRGCGGGLSESEVQVNVSGEVLKQLKSGLDLANADIFQRNVSRKEISDDLAFQRRENVGSHGSSTVTVIDKSLNRFRDYNRERQVCVSGKEMKNLSQQRTRQKRAAGATAKTEVKGKLIEYSWHLKKEAYAESTIKTRTRVLRQLHREGADLFNPESVKETIARHDNWSQGYKKVIVEAYHVFATMAGLSWDPPRYKRVENLPFIPLEKEIDDLIAASGKKLAATLQLLKETAMRIGEARRRKWTDLDAERNTITCSSLKHGYPRQFKITSKLMAMLNALPKTSEYILGGTTTKALRSNLHRKRKRLASKLQNPRLLKITFHTLRHWKATIEYHKTKSILHVKELLGHRNINSTLIYTHLVDFENPDEWVCRTAKTLEEAKELIEAGFEYVTDMDSFKLFRKRK